MGEREDKVLKNGLHDKSESENYSESEGSTPNPRVSVVVPFHGLQGDLTECLDALVLSEHPSYEVIVVDDGSPIALEGLPNCVRRATRQGPATARNAGARSARGEILVFIDSDVIVSPGTLCAFEKAIQDTGYDAVQACYTYPGVAKNLATRFLEDFQEYKIHSISSPQIRTLRGGCFAVKAECYFQIGGFDENFKEPSQEDTDLGRRLSLTGVRILLAPSIRVLHNRPIKGLWSLWFRYYRILKSMVKLHMRTFLEDRSGKTGKFYPENTMSLTDQFLRPLFSLVLFFSCLLLLTYGCFSGKPLLSLIAVILFICGYLLVNAPFLRFVQKYRSNIKQMAGTSVALAGLHASLLFAILIALIEFPWKKY